MPLIDSKSFSPIVVARQFNESMPKLVVEFLSEKIGDDLLKFEVAIIGLAFKGFPETNDLRNSVSIEISEILNKKECNLTYYESSFMNSEYPIEFPKISKPKIFLILNNHAKNIDIVLNNITRTAHNVIYIFDPWRLMTVNSLRNLNKNAKLIYFTLSNSYIIENFNG